MLLCLLVIIGVLTLWIGLSRRAYAALPSHNQVHYTVTEDHWRIALVRYLPEQITRKQPIILCHGLGANHNGFDLRPDNSVTRRLTALGFDVWVMDLRGSGFSERPSPLTGKRFAWTFDDYLVHDASAAIEYVLGHTSSKKVHWLGHSMGGLILYGMLALGWSDKIQSAVVSGSSLNYSGSDTDFHAYKKLLWVTDLIPGLPAQWMSQFLAPLSGRIPLPTEKFNWWPGNLDAQDGRRLCGSALDNIPCSLLRQLATALEPSGLLSYDRSINYFERIADATTPVLAFAADEDRQCPPEAAEVMHEQLGSKEKELVLLGLDYGQATHYGHIDMLVGKHSDSDVYPRIYEWLEKHDT